MHRNYRALRSIYSRSYRIMAPITHIGFMDPFKTEASVRERFLCHNHEFHKFINKALTPTHGFHSIYKLDVRFKRITKYSDIK